MSAFMVDPGHIDFLVKAVRSFDIRAARVPASEGDHKEVVDLASRSDSVLGRVLLEANLTSMKARYGDGLTIDELTAPERYEYQSSRMPLDPVQILKACACFDYQSCEDPLYEKTLAHDIVESIRGKAIRALPGYSSAQWEISRDYANES